MHFPVTYLRTLLFFFFFQTYVLLRKIYATLKIEIDPPPLIDFVGDLSAKGLGGGGTYLLLLNA